MPSISRLLSPPHSRFRQSPPQTPPGRSRPSDDGPVTLSDRLAPLKEEWPAADCAASARMKTLNQRTAMPTATQQLLHAMHLHLALRATVRRGGSESGPPPPDLTRAITQAATALTQTERRALQPHLAEPQGWLEWSRSQLLRRGEKAAVAQKQGVLVETDAQRLLQSLRDALRSPAPRDGTRISAKAAQIDDPEDVHQQLRKAAAEIRTSGHWTGAGATWRRIWSRPCRDGPKASHCESRTRRGYGRRWNSVEWRRAGRPSRSRSTMSATTIRRSSMDDRATCRRRETASTNRSFGRCEWKTSARSSKACASRKAPAWAI